MRLQGFYTFISKANSKFFRQKFTLSRDARDDANSQSTFKACRCLFLSSKKAAAFRSCLMIFKWAIAIWLLSLTVDIPYVSGTGKIVSLSP